MYQQKTKRKVSISKRVAKNTEYFCLLAAYYGDQEIDSSSITSPLSDNK